MVKGFFVGDVPLIEVTVAWDSAIQREFFVLDTGFTGYLQVTPKMAHDLNLKVSAVTPTEFGDGRVVNLPTAPAWCSLEFQSQFVSVVISDGSPLAGIKLLKKYGYKATICCKTLTVELEQVAG